MPITIYNIAREANVGIATVSRVLNEHPAVAQKTREKVLGVARRLNYQPHAYSQGLACKKTNAVCTVIPFFTNYFFVEVLRGVQDRIAHSGYDLVLYGVTRTDHLESSLRRSMQRGRFDGMLYFSMSLPSPFAEKFRQMKTAVVLVDTYHPAFDSITVDNETGAYEATKHLLTLGHKRIGMIDAILESAPARKRLEGYQKALADFRIDFDNRYLKLSSISKQDGFSREAGYVSMVEMLDLGDERPTATFVSSDVQAIGALNALRDQGLRVPEDMAIVGFDDIELAKHLGITTVRQPMYEMGVLAVDKLLERITNPDLPASHMRFEPKLMVRHSCGATSRQVLPTN